MASSSSSLPFKYKAVTHLLGSNAPIHALTYSASPGTYILTGSGDRAVRLYNPFPAGDAVGSKGSSGGSGTGRLIQTYEGHGYEVLDVAVARDNAQFASVGGDRSVFLWDVSTGRTTRRLGGPSGHTARINSVVWGGESDSLLISGSFDASVRIWDIRSHSFKPVQVLLDAKDSISAVLVNGRDACEIVAGSVDARVRYYDVRMGTLHVDVLPAPVTSLARMRGGEALLVGTLDGRIRLLDRNGGTCLRTYAGHVNSEFRIRSAFGGKEAWVLGGSEGEISSSTSTSTSTSADGEVFVWNTLSGELVRRINIPTPDIVGRNQPLRKVVGSDGKEKKRRNVVSCVAWRDQGRGQQWCCAGTDGVVTVFGEVDEE